MNNQIIDRLVQIVGKDHVLHSPEDLAVYSYDGTFVECLPDVVVLPVSTEEVSKVVKVAAANQVPIVAVVWHPGLQQALFLQQAVGWLSA